ncbi:Utp11 protein-domain-containing protein [Cladochytrium replicatum]|nr:Utp11 protein-domain-containing protein [Cladochytrium replicatum]
MTTTAVSKVLLVARLSFSGTHKMSSLRKYAPRRTHRERGMPAANAARLLRRSKKDAAEERTVLLEKKKDYRLRAADYNAKQKQLKLLRLKAATRNPDEFYFGMINSKTKEGVHIVERNEKMDHETMQLLKTQDKKYISYARSVNAKKIERLQNTMHFEEGDIEEGKVASEDEDEDEDMSDAQAKKPKSDRKHTIFVDDEDEAKKFDPVERFDTKPEFLDRTFNRPRASAISEEESLVIRKPNQKLQRYREYARRELESRKKRDHQLRKMEQELDIRRALMSKGPRARAGTDANGLTVWKWKAFPTHVQTR